MKSSFQSLEQLAGTEQSVAVLDDFFPNLLTAFRVAEYNWYLERFPNLKIYSANPDFKTVHASYAQRYPQFADRVQQYDEFSLDDCTFVYMNFLNNAYHFLPALNARCIPFLLTLYPGGGFGLDEEESDTKLEMILASPLLCGVIATQNVTIDYLKKKGCPVPVYDIYGGAINPIFFEDGIQNNQQSSVSDSVKICFVAERYMPMGANKGYPEFISVATQLLKEFPDIQFSIVGSFNAGDIPLDQKTKESIHFKGLLNSAELKDFFLTQNMIISPNRPFLLHPGNFDGFPTGCCVEASLCGVTVVCSDELKLNRHYTNGVDFVICSVSPEAILEEVRKLIRDPQLLREIGARGQIVSKKIFDPIVQLGRRTDVLGMAIEQSVQTQIQKKLNTLFTSLQKTIADQAHHISTIETKLKNSFCGKCIASVSRLRSLVRKIRNYYGKR